MAVVKINISPNKCLSCALVTNMKNTSSLRKELMTGNMQCTMIKPCFIVDIFQIGVAASKALLMESLKKLTTKSLYTEILFNLSLSKNISQSLLKFGIGDNDVNLIIVSLADETEMENILSKVEGDVVEMKNLNEFSNETLIRKTYKISESELNTSSLLNVVVSKMATKDFVNF